MFKLFFLTLGLAAVPAYANTGANSVPVCAENELHAYEPGSHEVEAHLHFTPPGIAYEAGSKDFMDWGNRLTVKVDRTGKVTCYAAYDERGDKFARSEQRCSILTQLASWTYSPFFFNEKPVEAVVRQRVYEWATPSPHQPWPDESLTAWRISLERTSCLGSCPAYELTIDQNGSVTYEGRFSVDVSGVHAYHLPPEESRSLIAWMKTLDIWSASKYEESMILDAPDCKLTISLAGQKHEFSCGVGYADKVVFPSFVANEIDRRTGMYDWIHFSQDTLQHLEAEHFNFHSREGADILFWSLNDPAVHDEAALLALLDSSLPLQPVRNDMEDNDDVSLLALLEAALLRHHVPVTNRLLDLGALKPGDQAEINEVFRTAIEGGRLDMVKKVWELAGPEHRPSLYFTDSTDVHATRCPVALKLRPYTNFNGHWDGKAITQWLVAQGCDVRADRNEENLLDIALKAKDPEFASYLRTLGLTQHSRQQ